MQTEEYNDLGSDFETDMDATTQTDQTIGEVGQGENFGEQIPREDNSETSPSYEGGEDPLLQEESIDDEEL